MYPWGYMQPRGYMHPRGYMYPQGYMYPRGYMYPKGIHVSPRGYMYPGEKKARAIMTSLESSDLQCIFKKIQIFLSF